MGKIKLLYDVIRALEGRENYKGDITVNAEKDGSTVLNFNKEFDFNFSTGEGKISTKLEAVCCGNKAKHEGTMEFNLKDCCGHHEHLKKVCEQLHGTKCCAVKGHIHKLTFILGILDKVTLEENEVTSVLKLDLRGLCKELCKDCCKKGSCCEIPENCCACDCFKEFLTCDYETAALTVTINKDRAIEKLELKAVGKDRKVNAVLNLR